MASIVAFAGFNGGGGANNSGRGLVPFMAVVSAVEATKRHPEFNVFAFCLMCDFRPELRVEDGVTRAPPRLYTRESSDSFAVDGDYLSEEIGKLH